jgi:hypothetical protein
MRAQFVKGKDPKNTLRIGIEAILWNADLEEGTPEDVEFLYDSMNQADEELYKMLKYFIDLGDVIREEAGRTLYQTELGLILKDESDYGSGYFCHASSLSEIEKRLGRKIITE